MILQALAAQYDRLVETGKLDEEGWQAVNVSYALNLNEEGRLLQIIPLKTVVKEGKKERLVPKRMNVPAQVKRSSGVASNFLCDNASYLLGLMNPSKVKNDKDQKKEQDRTAKCFQECSRIHHAYLETCTHPAGKAILRFFDSWQPDKSSQITGMSESIEKDLSSGANLVFFYDGKPITDFADIREAWNRAYHSEEADQKQMQCLVTGNMSAPAILHPAIKGVPGAQATGASIVSFNAEAFESYGCRSAQGLNAPVSKRAAFAYGAALNYLISDRKHRLLYSDTMMVFWAEDAEDSYADLFSNLLSGGGDSLTQDELYDLMKKLVSGNVINWNQVPISPEKRFYILGIAPNAARLSVRFFEQNSFGAFTRNVLQHYERTKIVHPPFKKDCIPLWELLRAVGNPKSTDKEAPPDLAGEMLRAILNNSIYPATVFSQAELRIRTEHEVTYEKAAIIKSYLLKNFSDPQMKEAMSVELNEKTTYPPYVLGRLFSVLEGLQQAANPGINSSIKDRYFSSACATPSVVFPQLIKLSQAHLKKLNTGAMIYFNKQLTDLISMLSSSYPDRLNLQDQGVFQIGYYHQTQKRYEKKEDK